MVILHCVRGYVCGGWLIEAPQNACFAEIGRGDCPLVIGQERAERGLAALVPALLERDDSAALLAVLDDPHLRHVTATAQAHGNPQSVGLSTLLARHQIAQGEWHHARQTIAQLGALLDLDVLAGVPRKVALLFADDLSDLGEESAAQPDEALRRDGAWQCMAAALSIRRKGLSPLDPTLAQTLEWCAGLAQARGERARAVRYLDEALHIYEQRQDGAAVARCRAARAGESR